VVTILLPKCRILHSLLLPPPKPRYHVSEFVDTLSHDLDIIINKNGNAVVIVAGGFSQLDTSFLCQDFGLCQIFDRPTHGKKIIDKVFVSIPDILAASVVKSTLKTKHQAIHVKPIVYASDTVIRRRKVHVYDLRHHNIDALRYNVAMQDWSSILQCDNIDSTYDMFLNTIKQLIQKCIPVKYITLGCKNPEYNTPLVKSLLRQRNKLRHKGRIAEADKLAIKINKLTTDKRQRMLNFCGN
jgi:hypothetical protein